MRAFALLAFMAFLTTGLAQSPAGASSRYVLAKSAPLTTNERVDHFIRQSFARPSAFIRAGIAGAIAQANDAPPEWGQGADAYARRYASNFAALAVGDAVEFAGAAALRQDPRYRPCRCKGAFRRLKHAVVANFVTTNMRGKRRFAAAKVAGSYASGMTAVAWHPSRYTYAGDGLRFGTNYLVLGTIGNLADEFLLR